MIFTLEKTSSNEPIIKPTWQSSIDANDLFDLIVSTYPNQSIFIASFNGFENAVLISSKYKSIDNYYKWRRAIENKYSDDSISFHRGHTYIYAIVNAMLDSYEVGRYSIAGNFGQIYN